MSEEPKQLVVPPELKSELEAIILTGHTIAAIKRLRDAGGCNLAEAARWVDEWIADHFRKDRHH